jgi:hypothetical protein
MIFTLTSQAPRKGLLTLSSGATVQTPALMLPTRTLTVPHLTKDVLDRVLGEHKDRVMIEVYAEDLLQNPKLCRTCPLSIHQFAGLGGYSVTLATKPAIPIDEDILKSPASSASSQSSSSSVPKMDKVLDPFVVSENKSGRVKVHMSQIRQLAERFRPDLVLCPAQLAPPNCSARQGERTLTNTRLFHEHLSKSPSVDIALPSLISNTGIVTFFSHSDLANISNGSCLYLRQRIRDVEKWRSLVPLCDVINAGIAFDLAEQGLCIQPDGSLVDLCCASFKNDSTLLSEGCGCVGCTENGQGFLKAAVHHYLVVEEMLAPLLLTVHNLHQLLLFIVGKN